uniref:DEAD-box helicase OB fold domain-containing protein n=1 Tax=Elphidium margaritaceum TaxID=933848 RepID=A0A7S0TD27_9EUKA
MAKCLLMADTFHCVYEMTAIAAMLENVEKIWRRPKEMEDQKSDFRLKKREFVHVAGDHLTLLNIFNAYKCKKTHKPHQLRAFCKSHYWDFATLQRTQQIRQQIERILSDITSRAKQQQQQQQHVFSWMDHRCNDYYDSILKCLLSGFFMNVAVQGFGGKFWTFRVRTLDHAQNVKCVEIVDKASCHPTSVYYKNNARTQRNWIMFHDIQISHTVQLRVLSAVQPLWLYQANPRYYNLHALSNDKSPIANILIASASK